MALEFAGPLGPFVKLEDRERRETAWANAADVETVDAVLGLLTQPPSREELAGIEPVDFRYELTHLLELVGRRDPRALLHRIGPFVRQANGQAELVEVIGALGLKEGLAWLEPLVDRSLDEDVALSLACAFGEIGGPAAMDLLGRLEASTPKSLESVHEEIAIARDVGRNDGRPRARLTK